MMNIERLSLTEIKPYPNNPRKNKKGIAAVKRSIEAFGFTQPIIVNAEHVILCGHTRYEAAKELNLTSVPVIIKTDLTSKQEQAYVKSFLQLLPLFPLDGNILTMPLCRMESLFFHVIFKRTRKL